MSLQPDDTASFATLLRTLRDQKRMTQKTLAEAAEASQASLSAWESGVSLPRREKLDDLAAALDVDVAVFKDAYRRTGEQMRSGAQPAEPDQPLSVERLHAQARAHVRQFGADSMSVFVLGAANLTVMRRPELLSRRWKENLLWGMDYTIVWVLDLIEDASSFTTCFTTLSALEATVAAEWPAFRDGIETLPPADRLAPTPPTRHGVVNHMAVTLFEPAPTGLALRYEAAVRAAREVARQRTGPVGRALPLARADRLAQDVPPALAEAVRAIARQWHPETGVVIYRPHLDHPWVPAAANVRLMPVREEPLPFEPVGEAAANYWFWLAPAGAARLVDALAQLDSALNQRESDIS